VARDLDWREFLNRLSFCYGCGRFGRPQSNGKPANWNVLYQPRESGPPALHVCSERCKIDVQEAMRSGVVTEPLRLGTLPVMDADLQAQMVEEMGRFANGEE
jgi:hypothetical protein